MTVKPIFRIALLGSLLCMALPSLQAQTGSSPTLRQFIGVNLTAEDALDKAQRFSHVREFHQWADDISTAASSGAPCPFEGTNAQRLRWNPSYNTNRYISYDEFYQALPQKVSVVTQGAAPSIVGGGFTDLVLDGKPICRMGSPNVNFNVAADHSRPLAYKEQTIWQSLFAARYGAAPAGGFPPNFENIAATYVALPDNTGLGRGLVREMENFNEHDAAWHSSDNVNTNGTDPNNAAPAGQVTNFYFRPAEYAAMLSANYDGNCKADGFQIPGANGAYWGIKNLSPETQVVMSATADLRQRYINDVITSCQALRPCGTLPFDVLNMPHYPTTTHPAIGTPEYYQFLNGVRYFGGGEGTNPEAPNEMLKQRILSTLTDGPGLNLGTTKLWITELGYDSHGGTAVSVPVIAPFDRQTVQGQWLTRSIFEVLASRSVKRLYLYHMQDEAGTGLFTHTGLVNEFGKPKKSWFHVMTQLNVLGDYQYVETPDNDSRTKFFTSNTPANPGTPLPYDDPRIYKFLTGGNANQPVYALWVPSKENKIYNGMVLIPGLSVTNALKIEVQDFDENGRRTLIPSGDIVPNLGIEGGVYIKNLTITETPLYLKFNNGQDISDPVAQPVWNLVARNICCGSVQLFWDLTGFDQNNVAVPEVSTGTVASRRFKVYYAPTSAFPPGQPAFDLSKFTTVEENLAGFPYECVVTGLQPAFTTYLFLRYAHQ